MASSVVVCWPAVADEQDDDDDDDEDALLMMFIWINEKPFRSKAAKQQ